MKTLARILPIVVIVTYLTACNAGSSDAEHLKKAEGFIATHQTNAAVIELKNALKQNKDNAQARFLLGKLSLEMGDPASAEKELRRARKLGVPAPKVLPLLAEALLKENSLDKLFELDPTDLPTDSRARVLAIQGMGKLYKGNKKDAGKLIHQAMEDYPAASEVQLAEAKLFAATSETDKAIETLNRLLEKDPKFSDGWNALGSLLQLKHDHQGAVRAFSKAMEANPNDLASRLGRAMSLVQLKKLDQAQQDLDQLKQVAPQHAGVNYVQGLLYLDQKKVDEALSAFEQATTGNNINPAALYFLAAIHLAKNNLEQADSYANRFLALAPANIAGRKLAARIKLRLNRFADAQQLLVPIVEERKDEEAMNLLATALIKQGKTGEAIALLEKLSRLKPKSATAQLRLGAGLMLEGEEKKAATYLKNAAKLAPDNPQAEILLIVNLLQQKKLDEAIAAAQKYQQKHPKQAAPYNLLAKLQLFTGDRQKAMASFEQATRLEPGNPEALLALAQLEIHEKEYDKARKHLETLLQHHKGNLAALMQLAKLDLLDKNEEKMVSRLEEAAKINPKASAPRLTLARYYLTKNQPEQASLQLEQLDKTQRHKPEALRIRGMIELANKSFKQAKNTLKELATVVPKSAEVHFLLAQAYAGLNQKEKMEQELQEAIDLNPNLLGARIVYTRMLLQERKLEKVHEQLAVLKKTAGDRPDVMRLEAGLAIMEGDPRKAASIYERLLNNAPSTATMDILAKLKWGLGEREEALSVRKNWLAKHPNDENALAGLADTYLKLNRIPEALAVYERILEIDPRNGVALNNLAWYLRESDPAKALKYAERALTLAPKAAPLLDTYAMVLLANGEPEKALRQIQRAVEAAPKAPALQVHQARILAANGRKQEAIGVLERLLSQRKEKPFPEKAEAETLLEKLKSE